MSMLATRLDDSNLKKFELLAKIQHKTKSQLLKELIVDYLNKNQMNNYIKAAQNIAEHEKNNPDEYKDIYDLSQDWD